MTHRLLLTAAMAALLFNGAAALAAPRTAAKSAVPFGLTQAIATLQVCPNARFDGDSMMALGGVLQENQARINALPVDKRMDMMNKVVAEETAKATAWSKVNKLDCATAPERAAAYWNRTIQTLAQAQQAEALEKQKSAAGAPAAPKPVASSPVTLP